MCSLFEGEERVQTLDLESSWRAELSVWLRLPRGRGDGRAWAVLLSPELATSELHSLETLRHTYRELSWRGDVPRGGVETSTVVRWIRPTETVLEIAVETRALRRAGGGALAESVSVVSIDPAEIGELPLLGRGEVPSVPDVGGRTTRGKTLVIREDDIADYQRVVSSGPPTYEERGEVRDIGPPSGAVPANLQLLALLNFAGTPAKGAARAWYRRPVFAGAALTAAAKVAANRELWMLRPRVEDEPATILSIRAR